MSNPCIYSRARNLQIFSLLNSKTSLCKDISYNKIVTSFNDPSISRRMRYAQYVRNYKYTYIPEACGDNTGLRVGYPPTSVVATIIPQTHGKGVLYDMSYSVLLKWIKPCFTGCTPILSYTIKSIPGDLTSLITPENPNPIINSLQFGVKYAFKVITTNIIGDSEPSNQSNYILQYNYPNIPSNIQRILGDRQITLSWDEPFNGGAPIIYYNIYVNYASPFQVLTNQCNINNLTIGASYRIEVTAVNSFGDSYPGKYNFIGSTYPDNPANITFIVNPAITINWNPPISNGYAPIDYYRITYTDPTGVKSIKDVSANVFTTTIDGLTIGQNYPFSVLAHNEVGFTANPTIFNIAPSNVPLSPSITNITRTSNGLGLIIVWNTPAYNGGNQVLSYKIYYAVNGITTQISVPSNVNSYTVYGMVSNLEYTFTITATNITGESRPSNPFSLIF